MSDAPKIDHDIAVVGAGAAGLISAIALARTDRTIICLDRGFGAGKQSQEDTRTIALLQSSVQLLKNLNVWPACANDATPLEVMRVIDDTGRFPPAPDISFYASELGPEPFGYNIPNETLVSALCAHARSLGNVVCRTTAGVSGIAFSENSALITTNDGNEFTVSLVAGADGPASVVRRAAGIKTHSWDYPQTALACWFAHARPHDNISTEFHRRPGPLVVVPMTGNRCGLVWVETPGEADRLFGLGDDVFRRELQDRLHGLLGEIGEISPRSAFPLSGLTARSFGRHRAVLVGHAAHVIPPIGAQGLNLGFRDAARLADCVDVAVASGSDIGGAAVIEAYDRARRGDVLSRTFAVDMLNRSLLSGWFPPVQAARGIALQLLKYVSPLRRIVMRQGLSTDGDLPSLMKAPNQ